MVHRVRVTVIVVVMVMAKFRVRGCLSAFSARGYKIICNPPVTNRRSLAVLVGAVGLNTCW